MSPYYVMFGCEPRLPVDFLLGSNGEGGDREVTPEDWVHKHQESLRLAYLHVERQLKVKAAKRNQQHNESLNDDGLVEGDLVYVKNHPRGRHKIQDQWSSRIHKVLHTPPDRSVVYAIVPVHEEGPVRHLHRTELRKVPDGRKGPVRHVPIEEEASGGENRSPGLMEEDSDEGHSLMLHREPVMDMQPTEDLYPDTPLNSPNNDAAPDPDSPPSSQYSPAESELSEEADTQLRRSTRATAGQHKNPFRLPQSVASPSS